MSTKDDSIVIKKDKVYSSYYARACKIVPDWKLVAISRGIPDNFNGSIMRELNPPQQLLFDYKNGRCTEEEYKQRYYDNILSTLNPNEIYNKLKGKVILCYCGKYSFCHRNLVLKWLEDNLGSEVIGGEI
jgi:hypothetical protein